MSFTSSICAGNFLRNGSRGGVVHRHPAAVRSKLSPNTGVEVSETGNCCASSKARSASSRSPRTFCRSRLAEKCARSSRTRNRTPAGVGFSLDRVFVEGSAASIAAGFISAASAELVTPASTRPMTMHPEDACSLPCGGAGGSGLSRCRVPREGTDVRLRW
jgi:hypothetical protein